MKKMSLVAQAMFTASTIALTGCGPIAAKFSSANANLVAADPLATLQELQASVAKNTQANDPTPKKDALWAVVTDSLTKCQSFMTLLVTAQNTVNTTGDVLTTIFSALATVFTPLSTVHALTAGATITSGSKAAFSNDVFAKASVSNLSLALQGSYVAAMNSYAQSLDAKTEAQITDLGGELYQISERHGQCSLAALESTTQDALSSSGPPTTKQGTGAGAGAEAAGGAASAPAQGAAPTKSPSPSNNGAFGFVPGKAPYKYQTIK
jgi:hypothetical protein